MGAWQIYLLNNSPSFLPTAGHGYYSEKNLRFSLDDLPENVRQGIKGKQVTPFIGIYDNYAIVSCCYWNSWKGLVRENVVIVFEENKVKEIRDLYSDVLYKFDCGIRSC